MRVFWPAFEPAFEPAFKPIFKANLAIQMQRCRCDKLTGISLFKADLLWSIFRCPTLIPAI